MKTILVVDDNETQRYLSRTILQAVGYEVITAENGAEALEAARSSPPDLIISDVLMPVMDGFMFRRACRAEPALNAIPFMIYTATYLDARDETLAYQLGVTRYVTGPVENDELLRHVRDVLRATPGDVADTVPVEDSEAFGFYREYNAILVGKLEQKMTELALANQALAARERFALDTLDGLSAHIAIVNHDGVIEAVNKAWRDFSTANTPLRSNICEGANYLAVCDAAAGANAAEAGAFAAAIRTVLAGKAAEQAIEYPCHSASEQRWFIGRVTRFPGEGPPRAIIAHENITARVLAENALRANEAALRRSQEVAHVGHWTWDTRANKVTWSDEMKRIFGLDPVTFEGDLDEVIQHAIHPDDRALVFAMNEAVIHDARPADTEYRVVWPDGTVRSVLARPGERVTDAQGAIIKLSGIVQDVTEQKRAENELRRNLQRLSIATKAGGLGIWESDVRSGFQMWDERTQAIYGSSGDEVPATYERWMQLVHPDDLPGVLANEQAAIERGVSIHNRFRIVRPDGAIRHVETHAEPRFGEDGTLECLVGVDQDVTEWVESEERVRLQYVALEAAANAIVITDANGSIQWVNPAFSHLTGYSAAEALHRNPRELVRSGKHPGDFYQELWHTILDGKVWRGELINRRKDGSFYHEEQTITPVRNAGGQITHFVAIKQDVSQRVRHQEESFKLMWQMRAQAEQLTQIIRSVPEGVLLLDVDRHVVQANPQGDILLHQIVQRAADGAIDRLGDQPLDELLTSPPAGEWHLVRHDGRSYEVAARPVESGPVPAGWVLVLRDVSDRLAAQMQLQRQERLAAVGQLAAGIAHDFNNIMSVIITYAELSEQAPGLTPRERARLVVIREQALRATTMIRQILDFSRRSVMEMQTLDLLPLVKEQRALLSRTLPEHIEIALDFAPADYVVKADPTRMQQMLMNLAVNARDAMPEGGRLTMALSHVVVAANAAPLPGMAPGAWVRVQIADTGTGIAPEDMPHIFEPFFTTKEVGAGTGLGLAQVHGIVAQHGGHITVASTPGAGTTFVIYLPALVVASDAAASVAGRLAAMPHGCGQTILVVEDDQALRTTLVEFLETLEYTVLEATDGTDALHLLDAGAEQPALILSDVVMPHMGGVALLKELYRRERRVPVILLTGHTMGDVLDGLRELGMAGWMPKPPPLRDLAELIANTLRS
ncbi:MAG: PAS domain S-box protein [Caldilinea sp.]|nr:PAS domain S-box protein [Caldilinea sp.]HRW47425.1 PAS domain S-box protein [Caldilinea sp.]